MFTARVINYLGDDYKSHSFSADFRFNSSSFKWCYYQSIHFACQALYMSDYINCIMIELTGDIMIAVSRTGITIDTSDRVFDIEKERK